MKFSGPEDVVDAALTASRADARDMEPARKLVLAICELASGPIDAAELDAPRCYEWLDRCLPREYPGVRRGSYDPIDTPELFVREVAARAWCAIQRARYERDLRPAGSGRWREHEEQQAAWTALLAAGRLEQLYAAGVR